jgi:hypothetical protein
MKIKLCQSQIDAILISELKRWYQHIKKSPSEPGDKELLRSLKCVHLFYTNKLLK